MDDWATLYKKFQATFREERLNASVLILFEDGTNVWYSDLSGEVEFDENTDKPAKCTLKMSYKDADAVINRRLSPMKAILSMRLKVKGDMGLAMRIAQIFKKPLPAV